MLLEDTQPAVELRAALDKLVADENALSDSDVLAHRDKAAALHAYEASKQCKVSETGGLIIEKLFIPRRSVLLAHFVGPRSKFLSVEFFVYGHLHVKESHGCLISMN
jgi:hypothetical protein